MMADRLPAGATIGILGGGQLGRMLSMAAARLGYRTHVFEPQEHPPASDVAFGHTCAEYADLESLRAFAGSVDVVTLEFENIPLTALNEIAGIAPVFPPVRALEVSQDRLTEKEFLTTLGLRTAPFANVQTPEDLERALATIDTPAILKTRRFGYDGKGQVRIKGAGAWQGAFDALNGAPAIVEGFVPFQAEISVIAARSADGRVACFDPGENVHRDGILYTTRVPARISGARKTDAVILAGRILNALDYVGVMGVELFVVPDGLVVNEIAPRVHNSGHWTQNGCVVDQFEQHIRAIAGLDLGDGQRCADVTMTNLVGDDVLDRQRLFNVASRAVHLYGKGEIRAGRKMGHVNDVTPLSGS